MSFELLNYSHQLFLKQDSSAVTSSTEESTDTFLMGKDLIAEESEMEAELE
jgi:hypothetical protein